LKEKSILDKILSDDEEEPMNVLIEEKDVSKPSNKIPFGRREMRASNKS
jgi:hypothetical protein